MLQSIEGIYSEGTIVLLEKPETVKLARKLQR